MAILGAKAATKDVDLVFHDPHDLENVEKGLTAMGARRGSDHRNNRTGARRFWVTPDGMGWDLFVQNIIGFPLYPQDFASATAWIETGNLSVFQLSADLIFIMKAFTPRTRDIGDLYELLSLGLVSIETITEIVRRRIEDDRLPAWLPNFYQGVNDMALDRDVDVRWIDEFSKIATDALLANRIMAQVQEGPMGHQTLIERLATDPDDVHSVLKRLRELGRLESVGGDWRIPRESDS